MTDNLAAYSIPALVQAANGFGDRTCAISAERTVTFREFAADVTAIADHLQTLGIVAGDRVAILDRQQTELSRIPLRAFKRLLACLRRRKSYVDARPPFMGSS